MPYENKAQAPRAKANWKELGEGKFVNWEDNETKEIVLYKWGQVDRDGEINLEADVLRINGEEFSIGKKLIRTGSRKFVNVVKPFLLQAEAEGKNAILLKITRRGIANNTNYFVERITTVGKPATPTPEPEQQETSNEQVFI